jgi:hypothetical protein
MGYLSCTVTLLVTHIGFIVTWILFDGDSRFCKKKSKNTQFGFKSLGLPKKNPLGFIISWILFQGRS